MTTNVRSEVKAPSTRRPNSREDFDIAIICALGIESNAVEASFDHFWDEDVMDRCQKALGDQNSYSLGTISGHNAVIAYSRGMGKSAAASVAVSCRTSFPNIRLALVVGICGGVPFPGEHDRSVHLGDVIVSTGIVQYDFGRQYEDRMIRKDAPEDNLGRSNAEIRTLLTRVQGWRIRQKFPDSMATNIAAICGKDGFQNWNRPVFGAKPYPPHYRHKHYQPAKCAICDACTTPDGAVCEIALESTCEELGCSNSNTIVLREKTLGKGLQDANTPSQVQGPTIHFGRMASGDTIIKSAIHRDRIAQQEKVLGFETEGAGVWDNLPTIIVKGVSVYADSHKDKSWQKYAAVTAAACAKMMLLHWSGVDRSTPDQVTGPQTEGVSPGAVFNNHGTVHNQANHQVNHGPMYFSQVHHHT